MNKKIFYIEGMTCAGCEKLLEDELGNISGAKEVRVDRKTGRAEISYLEKEPDWEEIKKTTERLGYGASLSPKEAKKDRKGDTIVLLKSFLIVVVVLFIYRIFRNSGFIDSLDLGTTEITFGVALLVGLVSSLSSCLVVVGGVVIGFFEKYQNGKGGFYESSVRPNLLFQFGRLSTFFLLGGVLGAIGGELSISGNFISVFTIIIAAVMAWLGLNILGVLPSVSSLGLRLPKKLTGNWEKLKKSEHKMAPFLLGALSFFLPCGFTQSMQIFALASGSFWTGAVSLLLFALGTLPALLVLGLTASWTKNKGMVIFQKAAGILIILFAVYTFNSGLALKGFKTSVLSNSQKENIENNPVLDKKQEQVVEMSVNSRGFEPSVLKIKKGIPVRWVIKGDKVTSCTNKIIVPSLNISKSISYGENIILFTPEKYGEIPFSCWMGMVRGRFIVE